MPVMNGLALQEQLTNPAFKCRLSSSLGTEALTRGSGDEGGRSRFFVETNQRAALLDAVLLLLNEIGGVKRKGTHSAHYEDALIFTHVNAKCSSWQARDGGQADR